MVVSAVSSEHDQAEVKVDSRTEQTEEMSEVSSTGILHVYSSFHC